MSREAVKAHILEAAINAIEKYGIQRLTTRLIAQEAGVNNAALHYYFGTKEELVRQALDLTLDHMLADTTEILASRGPIESRLREMLSYLIEGMLKFPNIIRAHLLSPLMLGEANSPFEKMLDIWLERTTQEVHSLLPGASREDLRIALHTSLAGALLAGLMPGSLSRSPELDLHSDSFRERYITLLITLILNPAHKG